MPPVSQIAIAAFVVVVVFAGIKLFSAPFRWALKIALSTALGFVALIVFNMLGQHTGVTLGVNLVNSLVIGVLGLPGFAVLVCLKLIFF